VLWPLFRTRGSIGEIVMWKTVFAGTAALAIAGATLGYAQHTAGAYDFMQTWRPSAEDITAFGEARIAALHAGLMLTAEQEKNWPATEKAMRELIKQRSERFAARASAAHPTDPVERLTLRADLLSQRGAALKQLADALGPLYKSLDDAQKRRFVVLAQFERRRFASWHGMQRGGWMHRGLGNPQRMTPGNPN
jgi:zinc resistance-associated protein